MPRIIPLLSPGMNEFLKGTYEKQGHVSLVTPTLAEAKDLQWLTQKQYVRPLGGGEYVLLAKGWEHVERGRLVGDVIAAETGRIWRGALELKSHPQDEAQWIGGLVADGIDETKVRRILNTLLVAGMI